MTWVCEWCDESGRASKVIAADPERATIRYCLKCKAKCYHAPMKDDYKNKKETKNGSN